MTRPAPLAAARAEAFGDPVGTALERLAEELGATCLLEDGEGRLLAHAVVGAVAPAVVDAVLRRDAAPLHGARGRVRTAGLTGHGPLVATTLGGGDGPVLVVPVEQHGWLWVLGPAALDPAGWDERVAPVARALERVACPATDAEVLDLLTGAAPPVQAVDHRVLVVLPADGAVPARRLDAALRRAVGGQGRVTATRQHGYVVLTGAAVAGQVLRAAEEALGARLSGVVAPAGLPLPEGRALAEESLAAHAVPGQCLTVQDCRPHLVLPHLLEVLDALPTPGGDPLQGLLQEPRHLAETLLAWLDHLGDTVTAAAALDVHPNTFRYRLRRARDLVPTDLDDPVARLELHLRLRSALVRRAH